MSSKELEKFDEIVDRAFFQEEINKWFYHNSGLNGSVNQKGFFVNVCDEWVRAFGWSKEELCGRPFIEFVHPDDVAETMRVYNTEEKNKEPFENRYLCKDDSYKRILWSNDIKFMEGFMLFTAQVIH